MTAVSSLSQKIQTQYPQWVTQAWTDKGDDFVLVKRASVREFMASMKNDPDYDFSMLIDLFAVDYLHWEEKENRFELTYNLHSLQKKHRLFVRVEVSEREPEIESVVALWPAADWFERETWDMMGIVFKGHPNLKRILMYEGFQGHALRKDYPYNRRQPIIGPLN